MKVLLFLVALLGVSLAQKCDPEKCKAPCRCMSPANPGGLATADIPQFVMLTFDDAVNVANFQTYKDLFLAGKTNPSKCNVGATFFVAHDYNNYAHLHQLWGAGSEIAVHTITHETNIEMWKKAPADRWTSEVVGMRTLISKLAQIPEKQIVGFRAPFLQTSGNTTFEVLHKENFLYDTSLTTRSYAGLANNALPIWPYSMDYKNAIDCIIRPCPSGLYPGFWEVPLVSHFRLRVVTPDKPKVMMPCAMADACLPFPETADDTYQYFMQNFDRHYKKNRAPFPLFLHEAWLREPGRREGYFKFFEYLMGQKDVFIVTIQEVLNFIKSPKPIAEYKEARCVTESEATECTEEGQYCYYELENEGSQVMYVCGDSCPEIYPTLENWREME